MTVVYILGILFAGVRKFLDVISVNLQRFVVCFDIAG